MRHRRLSFPSIESAATEPAAAKSTGKDSTSQAGLALFRQFKVIGWQLPPTRAEQCRAPREGGQLSVVDRGLNCERSRCIRGVSDRASTSKRRARDANVQSARRCLGLFKENSCHLLAIQLQVGRLAFSLRWGCNPANCFRLKPSRNLKDCASGARSANLGAGGGGSGSVGGRCSACRAKPVALHQKFTLALLAMKLQLGKIGKLAPSEIA